MNIKLEEGDLVPLFLSPKNDEQRNGTCILIKKLEEGMTFFEDDYVHIQDNNTKSWVSSNLTSNRIKGHKKIEQTYRTIGLYFSSNSNTINTFYKKMYKACTKEKRSPTLMMSIIADYKNQYQDTTDNIKGLLDIEPKHIINYIQQKKIRNWQPSLFKLERWVVDILPEDKFGTKFRTKRWIKVLVAVSPSTDHRFQDSLGKLMTKS